VPSSTRRVQRTVIALSQVLPRGFIAFFGLDSAFRGKRAPFRARPQGTGPIPILCVSMTFNQVRARGFLLRENEE
jgi:hypothetical protein